MTNTHFNEFHKYLFTELSADNEHDDPPMDH